jgi:hypothetical protein
VENTLNDDVVHNEHIHWFMNTHASTQENLFFKLLVEKIESKNQQKTTPEADSVMDELRARLQQHDLSTPGQSGVTSTQTEPASKQPKGNQPAGRQSMGTQPKARALPAPIPAPKSTPKPTGQSPQLWSKVASKAPKPNSEPAEPPEGLTYAQKFYWRIEHGLEMPTEKNKAKQPVAGSNSQRHARDPPSVKLKAKKDVRRQFGSSKFPFHPFPFNPDDLFTMDKYPVDTNRQAKDDKGREKRKDPAMGSSWMPYLDRDEDIRPCFYVYVSDKPCPYPADNKCLANHNVTRDQFLWLIIERKMNPKAVNWMIERSRSNTPEDMLPANRLDFFPPTREEITEPTPKGTMTEAEIVEWRNAHTFLPKLKGNESIERTFGPRASAYACKVQADDVKFQAKADAAQLKAKASRAANTERKDLTQPTIALDTSRYASNPFTRPSRTAAKQARNAGGSKPE